MPSASQFLKQLTTLTKEQLVAIKGVGDVLADNIIQFRESERYRHLVSSFEKLEQNDIVLDITKSQKVITGSLVGQVICITGTFDIPRSQIAALLEEQGAKVIDAVTSTTTLLLCGVDAGSKLEKAKKLGIDIKTSYQDLLVG